VSLTIITKPVVVFVIKIKQAIGLREQQRGEVCRKNAKGLRLNNRLFSPFLLLLFYLPCLLYDNNDVVWDRMIFLLGDEPECGVWKSKTTNGKARFKTPLINQLHGSVVPHLDVLFLLFLMMIMPRHSR